MAEPLAQQRFAEQPISRGEAEALYAQLRKWQERVPKLAAAVRTRAEALDEARREIRRLQRELEQERSLVSGGDVSSEVERARLEAGRAAREEADQELDALSARNQHLFQALQIATQQLAGVNASMKGLHETIERREQRICELETQLAAAASVGLTMDNHTAGSDAAAGDDLTQIRGIGHKLAEQVRAAGYRTFAELADLTEQALEDAGHPLHSLRKRVARDDWIAQAHALCAPETYEEYF